MLSEFQKYFNNFCLSITGLWLLSQKDIREKLRLAGGYPSSLATSINAKPISVNLFELSLILPEAPFYKDENVIKITELQARLLVMGCFDWLKQEFKLDTRNFSSFPEIVKIFYCLRNASAHNNIFQFSDERVKKSLPLYWRGKTLDFSDEGKELFSRWMSFGDIFYFLEDVSKEYS